MICTSKPERSRQNRLDNLTNGGRRNELSQNDEGIEMRRKNGYSREKSTCHSLIIIIGIAIFLSLASLGLSGFTMWKTFGYTLKLGSLCLNVTEYKNFEIPEYTLSKDVRNNNFMYCASSRTQVETLLTWIIEVKSREQGQLSLSSSLFENHAVFAHVIVGPSENVRMEKKDLGEVILNTDNPLTYIKGIKSGEHRLIVEKTGTYYVYSKVYFKLSNIAKSSYARHFVRRNNYAADNLIFSNENLVQHKRYYRTSYLSGTLTLNMGDEVFMCVQNFSQISNDVGSNFMGLFLLD